MIIQCRFIWREESDGLLQEDVCNGSVDEVAEGPVGSHLGIREEREGIRIVLPPANNATNTERE